MTKSLLDLVLFVRTPLNVARAIDVGIRSFMVDMEWRGKHDRQTGANTEIDPASAADLEHVCHAALPHGARVFCRINPYGPWTAGEVDRAIECGAERLFLPMVKNADEVAGFLAMIGGRSESAILIETEEAVAAAASIAPLPTDAVYIGLNDLSISRGVSSIFPPMCDGTIEYVRKLFAGREFGFGGVTALDGGHPLPCRLLLEEMVRLDCSFSFLRRSFMSDLWPRLDCAAQIELVRGYLKMLTARTPAIVEADHINLCDAVSKLLVPSLQK
ncbi:aldolase/citrate lyase family protein [Ferribacterium limneticum]|uniref:aldolase/citrate lyase family protein n=1 Tax=Ferribacterium limneticum TaxID=76259 RepID=UPI001CFB5A2B|nr:aldolase/citrate lyase family protein [Ferribacterium limneticum]UCV20289.1 hypothetical protein KI610_06885 [Ferribacterium limneticum]